MTCKTPWSDLSAEERAQVSWRHSREVYGPGSVAWDPPGAMTDCGQIFDGYHYHCVIYPDGCPHDHSHTHQEYADALVRYAEMPKPDWYQEA